MNHAAYPFIIAVLAIGVHAADIGPTEELAQLQKSYQAMRELKMAPLIELQNKYRNKLNALLEEAKSAGNLDAALVIRNELDAFPVRPTELPGTAAPTLAQAQQVYLTHKNRIIDSIAKDLSMVDMRYLEQLDTLEKKLTQAGNLSSALRVRQAGEAIRKEVAARPKASSSTHTSGPIRKESIDALKSDLVAYWPFDRDCNDRKGRHDGVIKGSGITFSEGHVGKAVRLTQDSYIAIPHDAALNLNHPFTIALWIKLDNADGRPNYNRGIISKSFAAWMLYIETQKNMCFRVEGGGTLIETRVPIDQLPEGKWTHIAATFDTQEAKLYVNGAEAAAKKSESPFVPNVNDGMEVRFGPDVGHWFWWFYGMLDEVRIYKKGLTDTEINALIASGAPLGVERQP